jgi:hypothetical protein
LRDKNAQPASHCSGFSRGRPKWESTTNFVCAVKLMAAGAGLQPTTESLRNLKLSLGSPGEVRTLSSQLQILRELRRDLRSFPHPLLNCRLVLAQHGDAPTCPWQPAANHIHEYLNLPWLEVAAIQIPTYQFFNQPIKLHQDRIVIKIMHMNRSGLCLPLRLVQCRTEKR